MEKSVPLFPGHYYHVYNRGNNRENIFFEDRNYHYFLRRCTKYIEPVAETFAYCLMRNHFHFLIRVREHAALDGQPFAGLQPAKGLTPVIVSRHFSNLFNTHAQAINKAYGRTGSLFQRRFGRKEVIGDRYFLALIHYIHFNPQKHRFVEDFCTYPYASYSAFLSAKPTRVKREAVLNWFGDTARFVELHRQVTDEKTIQHLIEDDVDEI